MEISSSTSSTSAHKFVSRFADLLPDLPIYGRRIIVLTGISSSNTDKGVLGCCNTPTANQPSLQPFAGSAATTTLLASTVYFGSPQPDLSLKSGRRRYPLFCLLLFFGVGIPPRTIGAILQPHPSYSHFALGKKKGGLRVIPNPSPDRLIKGWGMTQIHSFKR